LGVGDRVAAFLPNIPECVIAMLATATVGATFSSCSPDFGADGVVDRFGQIEPAVLFTATACTYAGKTHDCLDRVASIVERIPSIRHTVVVPDSNGDNTQSAPLRSRLLDWGDIESNDEPLRFEQLPFDHPLYILFSSGTTGPPKCIVHGAGGTLLQHLKEHQLHSDIRRDDTLFYFTTCGWMMWNWLASGLASGCTIVLYDGSPFHPHPGILFDMAESEGVTVFGTSAKYIAAVEKAELVPRESHDLPALKTILSTGSPLAPESFDFVYADVKADVCLSSISGGTDIVSCFALGNPIGSVWRGELQTAGLGMAVDVFDDDGKPITGEKGELVCTKTFPSMPLGFWNDADGEKYRQAYFARFPNVWHHGDYAQKTSHEGLIIHGRSDVVLNPGGVRIGTAEIYRLAEQEPYVIESLAVGQQWEGDERIILFVHLRDNARLDAALIDSLKQRIRKGASPRHVPAKIIAVPEIPRTKSGKIVEATVRDLIHGRPVKNRHALANPESLDHFTDLKELRT
ncbi:MAG: acetoacetate--CoA ligase, partial [Planctomycetes bacterium]|nr:acetoacetate--CoA ligase [Planctomycetota bacterium]